MFKWWRQRQREQILREPFSEEWRQIIAQNVGYFRCLDATERQRLEDLVQVFVPEKTFVGAGGLELTDEIRVTVAANACMLLLGRSHDLYRDVDSIVVYPSTVRAPQRPHGIFDASVALPNAPALLLGEAHLRGPVILVWDAVAHGSRHPTLGHNVVLHEFAHKLDMLDNVVDGTPPLDSRAQYARWSKACGDVFFQLQRDVAEGREVFLDAYGATSEAEFFAVATEFFFEKPSQLVVHHPHLYAALKEFYNQDPADRVEDRARFPPAD